MQFIDRKLLEQAAARTLPLLADKRRDLSHGLLVVSAGRRQLLDEQAEDVELANGSEPLGDLPEAASQARRDIGFNLKNGKDFAQPPRCHPGLVQGAHVALVEAL